MRSSANARRCRRVGCFELAVRVCGRGCATQAEQRSGVGAQRRPPQHEPPPGAACRAVPQVARKAHSKVSTGSIRAHRAFGLSARQLTLVVRNGLWRSSSGGRPGPGAGLPPHRHLDRHQVMLHLMPTPGGEQVRTTINIDDELLAKATKLAGPLDRTAVVSEALKALIERESAKRLARLGGTQPKLKAAPRRRQGSPG